jgi:hypothetical protein
MNLSETVDKILELHRYAVGVEKSVADYLESTFRAVDMNVAAQQFTYSLHTRTWVGGAVFVLSIILLACIVRRWHRAACIAACAIPLILSLEILFDVPIVSFPTLKKSENIIADFPVQDAARRVIIGTSITLATPPQRPNEQAPSRLEDTVAAFILPMALVVFIIGIWQLFIYFHRFEFEDAHTIMMIMGFVCVVYAGLLFGVFTRTTEHGTVFATRRQNAGSIAVLAALAEDLNQKHPRLETTWVTLAFLGSGPDSRGARALAKQVTDKRKRTLPTYFVGCERLGRGGSYGFVIPAEINDNPLMAERDLIRALNRAALAITGRQLEIVPDLVTNSQGFADYGVPSLAITTRQRDQNEGAVPQADSDAIDRGQLLISLQLLEAALMQFEQSRSL